MKKLLSLFVIFLVNASLVAGQRHYNKAIDPDKLTRAIPETTPNEDDYYFHIGSARSALLSPIRRPSTEASTKTLRSSCPSKYSGHNIR